MGNSYDDALRAINEMFNNRDYSPVECRDNLKGL